MRVILEALMVISSLTLGVDADANSFVVRDKAGERAAQRSAVLLDEQHVIAGAELQHRVERGIEGVEVGPALVAELRVDVGGQSLAVEVRAGPPLGGEVQQRRPL